MADADVKISQLPSIPNVGYLQGTYILPIVGYQGAQGITQGITLSQLTSYITTLIPAGPPGPPGPQGYSGTTVGAGTTGAYYQTFYTYSNSVVSTPTGWSTTSGYGGPNSGGPWYPSYPTPTQNPGQEVVWSTTGLVQSDGSGLVVGTGWSTPVRVSKGQINFYQSSQPSAPPAQAGDVWFNTANNNQAFVYDGTTWNNLSTPFPYVGTSGFINALIAPGYSGAFTLVADRFQIVQPGYSGVGGSGFSPFNIQPNGDVYIADAIIQTVNAGNITTGTIDVPIQINTANLVAGTISNNFQVYNPYVPANTMPCVGWARQENLSPQIITGGPNVTDGTPVPMCTFYGWNAGAGGYVQNRFGLGSMIFTYNIATDVSSEYNNGIKFNVVYQINGGSWVQCQAPQASLPNINNFPLSLYQSGSVNITGLNGTETIVFGYQPAAINANVSYINYACLTVLCYNI